MGQFKELDILSREEEFSTEESEAGRQLILSEDLILVRIDDSYSKRSQLTSMDHVFAYWD